MKVKNRKIEEIDSGITTTHGAVPWELKGLAKGTTKAREKPRDYCPFMGMHCGKACAAYNSGACVVLMGGTIDPTGLCPVTRNGCKSKTCVMYLDGNCKLLQRGVNNE